MMKKIAAYFNAYLQYIQTPKGRHDFLDDLWAFAVFALSTALVMAIAYAICER